MIKLTNLISETKLPSFIPLDISADSVDGTYLTGAEVVGGIKLVDYAKRNNTPPLINGHYSLVKMNGKITLKLSQKGKTRIKIISRTIPDYLEKITKIANSAFTDYFNDIK